MPSIDAEASNNSDRSRRTRNDGVGSQERYALRHRLRIKDAVKGVPVNQGQEVYRRMRASHSEFRKAALEQDSPRYARVGPAVLVP